MEKNWFRLILKDNFQFYRGVKDIEKSEVVVRLIFNKIYLGDKNEKGKKYEYGFRNIYSGICNRVA